ncbi:MAG: cytochrome c oxidase subunit II [Gammaproteobacteria bacterium]|nr:cytochrome c oxidase subunit II [Gammaproteobacteria bacterium]
MIVAIMLLVIVIGSLVFNFLSPWWFTEIASNWGGIDFAVFVTFWICGVAFVLIGLFMVYTTWKYRRREGLTAVYEPENKRLEWILTIVTTIGVVGMLAPGLWVWDAYVNVPPQARDVEIVGQQWSWSYRLPGEDGYLGAVDARRISVDNPFGMDPDDPRGQDDVLIERAALHLPIDRPVKVLLRSKDVLHDFYVPEFRAKMDAVPGMITYMWFTPTRVGTYEVLCAELCGIGHHTMRGTVVVDTAEDYDAWLKTQATFAQISARPEGDPVAGQIAYAVCAACHGPAGEGMLAFNAPKLSGQDPWYLRHQILAYRQGLRGVHEQDTYGKEMAPMVLPLIDDAAVENVIAYIGTLPDDPAPQTVEGDIHRGASLYGGCTVCHGSEGGGSYGTFAPRVAGMTDWYLVRQLRNFREGIRGSHRMDNLGKQMGLMSRQLGDDEAINDVVAYINTMSTRMTRTAMHHTIDDRGETDGG